MQATLGPLIREVYRPWVTRHLRMGDETITRLLVQSADFEKSLLPDINAFRIERWRTSRRNGGSPSPATATFPT